jgi:serine/threonine-protein kinase HipA
MPILDTNYVAQFKRMFRMSRTAFNFLLTKINIVIPNKDYSSRRQAINSSGSQITNRTKETHGESYKYDGSYFEIGQLIKKYVPASMVAIEHFFKIIVFNYVFSNGDAHLKNFSLIRNDSGELELTPAYDLLSTIIHTPGESDTALQLFEKDYESDYYAAYGHYGRNEFASLARQLGVVEVRYLRMIEAFIEKKDAVVKYIENSFLSPGVKQKYHDNFMERIGRL